MQPEQIGQPHDRLVKQVFGRKESTARFLQDYIPQTLAASLDWPRLELRPGSFVDAKLRHHESDLHFAIPFRPPDKQAGGRSAPKEELLLYCLFEHQTNVDRWMIVRLLAYMVQIWQRMIQSHPKPRRLSPILPLVLYQGPTQWNVAVRFHEHLAIPADLAKLVTAYQPLFEHLLIDLSQTKGEELKGDIIGRLALGLLKAVAEGKALAWLERQGQLLGRLLQEREATGIVETLLRYLVAADSDLDLKAVQQALADVPATLTKVMSIAEQLRAEGLEKGLEQGLEKGLEKGLEQGLEKGTLVGQVQTLQEMLGLRVSSVATLSAKPTNELRKLSNELRGRLQTRRR